MRVEMPVRLRVTKVNLEMDPHDSLTVRSRAGRLKAQGSRCSQAKGLRISLQVCLRRMTDQGGFCPLGRSRNRRYGFGYGEYIFVQPTIARVR